MLWVAEYSTTQDVYNVDSLERILAVNQELAKGKRQKE